MYVSQYQAVKQYKQRSRETQAWRAERDLYLAATRKESPERQNSVIRRMMRWLRVEKQPCGAHDARPALAI